MAQQGGDADPAQTQQQQQQQRMRNALSPSIGLKTYPSHDRLWRGSSLSQACEPLQGSCLADEVFVCLFVFLIVARVRWQKVCRRLFFGRLMQTSFGRGVATAGTRCSYNSMLRCYPMCFRACPQHLGATGPQEKHHALDCPGLARLVALSQATHIPVRHYFVLDAIPGEEKRKKNQRNFFIRR